MPVATTTARPAAAILACAALFLAHPPLGARAAVLGANCNCYCCSEGLGCDPVHVGTVSVGQPGNESATCDACTQQLCQAGYKGHCKASIGTTIASCDTGSLVDGDPCSEADACGAVEVMKLDKNGEPALAQYDLSGLCKTQGYDFVDTENNAWFNINICGYSPKQCFPADCANDGVNNRSFEGGPCYPWPATANVGSVVRFFNDNIAPPPTTGTEGYKGAVQQSCYTDDGQPVQCTGACSVLQPSLIGPDGTMVQWRFSNDSDKFDGLIAKGPAVAVSTDAANPLGSFAPDGPQCQPTSEFDVDGVQQATVIFKCEASLIGSKEKPAAKIISVESFGCKYVITMATSAVCDPVCPPGQGICDDGPDKGFCSAKCATLGAFEIVVLVVISGFSLYCLAGLFWNKRTTGTWTAPHQDMWVSCLTCQRCRGQGRHDNSFQAIFGKSRGGSTIKSEDAGSAFRGGSMHPDQRRSSYGAV